MPAHSLFAYLLQEMERVETACLGNPVRNQPWIAAFLGNGAAQYVVVFEQYVVVFERKSYTKVSSLEMAIYVTFSLYYCLNFEYPDGAKLIFSFFQDFVLEEPDKCLKSATYLSVTSDIKHCLSI